MVRAHRSGRGSRSAADVVVGTGTDDEPSLCVTRDRNGLTLQGAQRGGRSQDDEALSVRHDGVGARWAGPFGRLDAPVETFRYAGEERQARACGDLGSEPPPLELTQLRYAVRIVRPDAETTQCLAALSKGLLHVGAQPP